jgi:transcriptional regulator with PAS, ATPase and Fis domain
LEAREDKVQNYKADSEIIFVGKSDFVTQDLPAFIATLGPLPDMVLIRGETGTGKSLVASLLNESAQRQGVMAWFNCAATPNEIFESELFGYQKGAFTGAAEKTQGAVAAAGVGTLCLDEVGEVPLLCQQKLLRLFDGWYKPLGTQKELPVEARILATTNCDLEAMVKEGRFRLDLFHRMDVHQIIIPPLRERRTDIRPLIEYFVDVSPQNKRGEPVIELEVKSDSCFELTNHQWPGNVRQLKNAVARAMAQRKETFSVSTDEILHQIKHRSPRLEGGQVAEVLDFGSAQQVARLQRKNLEQDLEIRSLKRQLQAFQVQTDGDAKAAES